MTPAANSTAIPAEELAQRIAAGRYDAAFARLYPRAPAADCRARYTDALAGFVQQYGNRPVVLISAPGRTEIGGNHTDHQQGRVLAAAVDLDVLCVAAANADNTLRLCAAGYPPCAVALCPQDDAAKPRQAEQGKPAGILRGMAAWLADNGYVLGGADMLTDSRVPVGSGLSSSAAFEVAVGQVLRALYAPALTPVAIAYAGQHAERHYWNKPSGLMDQMASALGGFSYIDFADAQAPQVRPVALSPADSGMQLCVVDTRSSHANLTEDYAAIPREMGAVAQFFGAQVLRAVDEAAFHAQIAAVRAACGDRAVLRALHFFAENARVAAQAQALEQARATDFWELVIQSGRSSLACLQNIYAPAHPCQQGLTLALALSEELLRGSGAWRVHGGGFAGTILAFVPREKADAYRDRMETVFGAGACHMLAVRADGGTLVTEEMRD